TPLDHRWRAGEHSMKVSDRSAEQRRGFSMADETRAPLVRVEDLVVDFALAQRGLRSRSHRLLRAVDGVSFDISQGETLGLVGESGSGKTTTGRAILRRIAPTSGRIWFRGEDITELRGERLRRLRQHMQMVFQDPYGSLNPRMRVLDIVSEPL